MQVLLLVSVTNDDSWRLWELFAHLRTSDFLQCNDYFGLKRSWKGISDSKYADLKGIDELVQVHNKDIFNFIRFSSIAQDKKLKLSTAD